MRSLPAALDRRPYRNALSFIALEIIKITWLGWVVTNLSVCTQSSPRGFANPNFVAW